MAWASACLPATSGSNELRTMVLPVIQASFADRFYINALQAGVWLVDSDDRRLRFGLAADAHFGWDADDSTRTKGMHDRDFSVDIGPALRWQPTTAPSTPSGASDTGGIEGAQCATAVRAGADPQAGLRLNGLVGLTWNDSRMNNYYFGVTPAEATPGARPIAPARAPSGRRGSTVPGPSGSGDRCCSA